MSLSSNIKYHFQKILKNSNISLSSYGGRNFLGRICVYHKGAGNKNIYRKLDFYRRLNQVGLVLKRLGLFYGQCSEICGVNHGFMPIAVKVLPVTYYLN